MLLLAAVPGMAFAVGPESSVLCIGCHGIDGNSTITHYPRLAGQGSNYLAKQLRDFKTGQRKEDHMTPIVEAIGMHDIPALADWFSQQKRQVVSKPVNPAGEKIFQNGIPQKGIAACNGCHADNGQGNDPVGFPLLAGQHAEYIIRQLESFRAKTRTNDNGMMQSIAEQLSDQEINSLAFYIESLP